MWKYYIVLFTDKCYGDLVESRECDDGLPVCCDYNVAKEFNTPEELSQWVKENTTLDLNKCEYGIRGIYYPETKINVDKEQITSDRNSGCYICNDTSNDRYYHNQGYKFCPHCGNELE